MEARILTVDDSTDTLRLLSWILRERYTILTAEGGLAALDILRKEPVELVISDVMMPGLDGFQLCQTIKTDIALSHIPVILLTAKRALDDKVEAFELGADSYMEKPVSERLLLAQIASLLANRKNIREYFIHSPAAQLSSFAFTHTDQEFFSSLNIAIQTHLDNTALDVAMLAREMNMSRASLYRKIKAISDRSPLEFITIVRLKKAAVLLAAGDQKIYEVALLTGFNSVSSFYRNFFKQFGQTPSEFILERRGLSGTINRE